MINSYDGFLKLTIFDQGGHAAWRPAMDECNCFSWMIAQKRGDKFAPPPERKVYTYRSTSNCFVVFAMPLLLAAFAMTFQQTRYCKQLLNKVKEKLYPVRKTNTENNETEESIIVTDQSFREWTDTSGKKLELKLIAIKGDTARFELRDGRKAKMKIKMLCQEDQEILKRWVAQEESNDRKR